MNNYIIPLIVLAIISYGLYKNINIYESFLIGVKDGLKLIIEIFPTIFAFVVSIDILIKSNIINDLSNILMPLLKIIKFPHELLTLSLLRPISGTSSLVILNNILKVHGPDSYIGRVASIIEGSTDTTIYIIGLYFASIGIKKTKYSLNTLSIFK